MDFSTFGKFTFTPPKPAIISKPNVNVTNSKTEPSTCSLIETLLDTLTSNVKEWPCPLSFESRTKRPSPIQFTIKSSNRHEFRHLNDPSLPDRLIEEVVSSTEKIRVALSKDYKESRKAVELNLMDMLIDFVFSSNFIESAGSFDFEETAKFARRVFNGERLNPAESNGVGGHSVDYLQQLRKYQRAGPLIDDLSLIARSRIEIINHGKAIIYFFTEFITKSHPLSEEMILNTHRILTGGTDILNEHSSISIPAKSYSGRYRTIPVRAGNTGFAVPSAVPRLMAELVQSFNAEIRKVEIERISDPFDVAARLSNDFVQIHPFADGNGRISRILLNAVLLKYTGVCVDIRIDLAQRSGYIGMMRRSGEEMNGAGESSGLVLRKSTERLRRLSEKLTSEGERIKSETL